MSKITDNLKDLALITSSGSNLTVNGNVTVGTTAKTFALYREWGGNTNTVSIGNTTDNVETIRMDSAGRIVLPNQPVFAVHSMIRPTSYGIGNNWNSGAVITNRGGFGYNTTTGVVTIPATGLYEISWHLLSSSINGSGQSVLRSNGAFVDEAFYNTGSEGSGLMTVAATRIVSLTLNDSICIERSAFNSGGSWYSQATGNCLSIKMIG